MIGISMVAPIIARGRMNRTSAGCAMESRRISLSTRTATRAAPAQDQFLLLAGMDFSAMGFWCVHDGVRADRFDFRAGAAAHAWQRAAHHAAAARLAVRLD